MLAQQATAQPHLQDGYGPQNVEKCIKLHNSIVSHASSKLPPHQQPKVERSWFAAHSLDPGSPGLDIELDEDLVAFLSGIDIVIREKHQHLAFTPFLIGISAPNELRPDAWEGIDEYEDFILLYKGIGHDPGGLVYSRTTHQVCFVRDPFDEPRERMWGDLHAVLELYLRSIESGKFVVDAEHPGFGNRDGLVTQGWRVAEWTEKELRQVLDIWESLVDAVTARLPESVGVSGAKEDHGDEEPPPKKKRKMEDFGLIPAEVSNKYPAIPPFARVFLSRAKKPRFTSIAPQLDVPNEAFIHRVGAELQARYPDASLDTHQHELADCTPFLLFPWRAPGVQFSSQDERDRWQSLRKQSILDDRVGLYLVPDVLHAHASTLLLPFQLGEKRHVVMGDGSTVDRPAQDALYRHGVCNPFMPDHGTPLAAILVNWWEQVENDSWSVNVSGVDGGEELWKKADTEEDAEDFQTDWSC
ncbi:hypothetical protein GT037_003151 [Alternaria burnsii]|uniref:Uncharacterized protein n=1 Tax=Alternaria burnsii TaxID=1187904 RepID=A0A8H7EHZ4_9PLEO|nr:uncharacterized protein GT037_003151 [Alternaria burnsii]KAF7679403.1 hypothetical protein GT037_003151 [Alternaria burnsii]CAI9631512.1 unnamed protein product [Alternaria burnsii]